MRQGKVDTLILDELNKMISDQNEIRKEEGLKPVDELSIGQVRELIKVAKDKKLA